ncbi:hypothetical protein GCM10022237_51380 [Nocardioides ginsengisoli]|uniref:ABC transporter permease n=1 Tax=Nocardioides ginsengisoli TaxID=363868 RepID=A0ABW3VX08_9ACTN
MSPLVAFRWTGAGLFLPVLFGIACLFAAADLIRIGYPTGDLANASYALSVAAPVAAGFTAARFHWFPGWIALARPARSGLRAVGAGYGPLVLGSPCAVCLAVVVTARTAPSDGPSWAIVGVDFATVLAACLSGLVLASALPVVMAVPVALLGWFWWLAYVPGMTSPLLHNMTSTFSACCDSSSRPAWHAVGAASVVTGTICLGVAALLSASHWSQRPVPVAGSVHFNRGQP